MLQGLQLLAFESTDVNALFIFSLAAVSLSFLTVNVFCVV